MKLPRRILRSSSRIAATCALAAALACASSKPALDARTDSARASADAAVHDPAVADASATVDEYPLPELFFAAFEMNAGYGMSRRGEVQRRAFTNVPELIRHCAAFIRSNARTFRVTFEWDSGLVRDLVAEVEDAGTPDPLLARCLRRALTDRLIFGMESSTRARMSVHFPERSDIRLDGGTQ